jgi:hypothetical protein
MRHQHVVRLWNPDVAVDWEEEIMRKVLGTILTMIIFINGDNRLKRMDFQRERLRDLYPDIQTSWMIVDAFTNSWCVAVCSLAIFPLAWATDDVNELILDTFGFLFLQGLAGYSSIIDFGFEQSDFDNHIQERGVEVDRSTQWVLQDNGHYERRLPNQDEVNRPHWLRIRFLHGDVFYSLGRVINCIAFCFGWPAYVTLKWTKGQPEGAWLTAIMNGVTVTAGLVLFGIGLCNNLCWYLMYQPRENRDFCDLFYHVLLLRPHPREVRQIQADVLGGSAALRQQSRQALLSQDSAQRSSILVPRTVADYVHLAREHQGSTHSSASG